MLAVPNLTAVPTTSPNLCPYVLFLNTFLKIKTQSKRSTIAHTEKISTNFDLSFPSEAPI